MKSLIFSFFWTKFFSSPKFFLYTPQARILKTFHLKILLGFVTSFSFLGDVGLDTIQGFQLEVIGLFVIFKGHKSMGAT